MLALAARRLFSHKATVIAAILGLSAVGCQASAGPVHYPAGVYPPGSYPPGTTPPPAPSAPGNLPMQRVIPLRIVEPLQCNGCTRCRQTCRDTPRPDDVMESVARANEVFAPTGVQFTFQGIDRVEAPTWWKHGVHHRDMTWAEVRRDAQAIFPWIPDNAYSDPDETKASDVWLEILVAVYGRPNEITIFTQGGAGNRGETHFPNGGRGMWVLDGIFGHGPGRGHHPKRDSLYLFSHELGHYLGLRHTFAHNGVNPITGRPWRLSDRWDLVYHPGSGPGERHVFFNSREEAARYPDSELRLIETFEDKQSNCDEDPDDGAIECVLPGRNGYSETHRSGDPALKGLSFPLSGYGRYRWARNALSYGDMEIPRRISASQIEMVRVYLQYPLDIGPRQLGRWGRMPDGMNAIPCHRTSLGLVNREPQ